MRLKYIERVDFRKSELTNLREQISKRKWILGPNEVALFISQKGDQVIFVYGFRKFEDLSGASENAPLKQREVLRSERFRLTKNGTWHPLTLRNSINAWGINLVGIKLFEAYYEHLSSMA